jgi:hypothetical protein
VVQTNTDDCWRYGKGNGRGRERRGGEDIMEGRGREIKEGKKNEREARSGD